MSCTKYCATEINQAPAFSPHPGFSVCPHLRKTHPMELKYTCKGYQEAVAEEANRYICASRGPYAWGFFVAVFADTLPQIAPLPYSAPSHEQKRAPGDAAAVGRVNHATEELKAPVTLRLGEPLRCRAFQISPRGGMCRSKSVSLASGKWKLLSSHFLSSPWFSSGLDVSPGPCKGWVNHSAWGKSRWINTKTPELAFSVSASSPGNQPE